MPGVVFSAFRPTTELGLMVQVIAGEIQEQHKVFEHPEEVTTQDAIVLGLHSHFCTGVGRLGDELEGGGGILIRAVEAVRQRRSDPTQQPLAPLPDHLEMGSFNSDSWPDSMALILGAATLLAPHPFALSTLQ